MVNMSRVNFGWALFLPRGWRSKDARYPNWVGGASQVNITSGPIRTMMNVPFNAKILLIERTVNYCD